MRWEDERYVRVYTRDTVDWLSLSFIAQGLFCLILRKVDRAGLMKLGKHGKRAVAVMVGFPGEWSRLEPALEELLADGSVQIRGEYLLVPNFIEAQDANQSDAQRKRESRARARDITAAANVLGPDKVSASVTGCPDSGQKVTSGHTVSHAVTPSLAKPIRAVPSVLSQPSQPDGGQADELDEFRLRLGAALGYPEALPLGKSPLVEHLFREQLAIVGPESLLLECRDLAAKSTTGTPGTLSWFVGWLNRLPAPSESLS
jgi:hypothetical protein